VARGVALRQTSSNEETHLTIEENNVAEDDGFAPPLAPPSTTMHTIGSSKNINAIRGWTKEDMMKAITDVIFNGYSIRAAAKKYGIAPTSMHYWLNGLTHTKRKGPLTVLTEQEEA
jgi:hypothetical protein